ncbi:hypothetical protein ACFL6B_00530 [Thermodesulfobacteriota bacterium]
MGKLLNPRRLISHGDFVTFHTGRCGSTVLSGLLKQHPKIYCDNELFYGYYGPAKKYWEKRKDIRTLWTNSCFFPSNPTGFLKSQMFWAGLHPFYGFEVTLYQIKWNNWEISKFIKDLQQLNIKNFIVLERKNYLSKIVSGVVAGKRGSYHLSTKDKISLHRIKLDLNNVTVDFDEKPLLDYLEEYDRQYRILKESLQNLNMLWLTYEDDIEKTPFTAYHRVCDFLEIKPHNANILLKKGNPYKLKEVLINYDEIAEILNNTPYQWMLDG